MAHGEILLILSLPPSLPPSLSLFLPPFHSLSRSEEIGATATSIPPPIPLPSSTATRSGTTPTGASPTPTAPASRDLATSMVRQVRCGRGRSNSIDVELPVWPIRRRNWLYRGRGPSRMLRNVSTVCCSRTRQNRSKDGAGGDDDDDHQDEEGKRLMKRKRRRRMRLMEPFEYF